MIGRREFMALLGGAAGVWPLAARAQQAAKLPTIGYLGASTPSFDSHRVGAFVQRLRERGWIEGRTVTIEYRWSEGRTERYPEIAAEFVRLKVDVIVTTGGGVPAVKQATSAIPIVFPVAGDPVGGGFVATLARPGGNVTGLSLQQTDVASKRVELLRDAVPGLRRMAILLNVGNANAVLELGEFQAAARTLGLAVATSEIQRAEDIVSAFEALKGRADAIYVVADPLVFSNRTRIHTMAMATRLPAIYNSREYVEMGGLMSYGPNFPDMFRRAADMVDKILRGAKPADLPVEQPTQFDLVINLTTAKALSLDVPPTLLARADEVIE
jgi:putative tryptophan/tyrosine transport system substrate-binding protein